MCGGGMGSGGNESAAAGNAGYDGPATATSPGSGKAENANAGRGGNGKGGRGRGPSSVSFGGKSYATVTDRYGNNISDGFGNPVASGMEVNGLSANGKPSMDRARGRRGGTLAAGASLTDDQLGQMIGAALNDVKGKQAGIGKTTSSGRKAAGLSYGPKDAFAGMLESIGSALSLGFVDPEINGMDYSFTKGRPVAKEPGLHFNPVAGLATALGGPLGTFGAKGLQQATGTVPGTYDEDGNVNTAMSMFGGKKGSKVAGGRSFTKSVGKMGFGVAEDSAATSLGGPVGKSSPGNGVGRDGGGGGSQRSTARKQWAAKTGSRANAGTGIPSRQSRSVNFSSDDDDLFSLYRHMLSGYFKGVKVKN